MAAEITSNGIQFSDSTSVNSRGWMTPDNTAMFFFQSAAPTHWVKSTSSNDKMLRVVTGSSGGSSGGSISFSSFTGQTYSSPWSSNSSTNNHTLTSNQIPSHTHSTEGTKLTVNPQNPDGSFNGGDVSKSSGWSRSTNATGGVSGPSQHSHPFSASGTTPNLAIGINVQYIDILQCNFDIDA